MIRVSANRDWCVWERLDTLSAGSAFTDSDGFNGQGSWKHQFGQHARYDIVRYEDVGTVTGAKGPSALCPTSLAGGADKNNTNSYSGPRHFWNISVTYIMKQILIMNRGWYWYWSVCWKSHASDQSYPRLRVNGHGMVCEARVPAVTATGGDLPHFAMRQLQ